MKRSSNHLEMMESRTLLSSAAHFGVFAFAAHSFGFADAIPFVAHFDHGHSAAVSGNNALANDADEVPNATNIHAVPGFTFLEFNGQLTDPIIILRNYGDSDHNDGWFAHFSDPDASAQNYSPPPASHVPGADDSNSRITGKPSRVPRADLPDASTPADVTEMVTLRDAKPVEAVSTTLLHESVDVTHAGAVITSPFASMATITMQGVFQAAKSNMIYLSFLDQNTGSDPFLVSLAARFRSVFVSLPAVVLRETGVAVFANGGNVLSSVVSQKSFEFAHFASPLMLVADSVGSFIQASTLAPFTANTPAAAARRAWAVTAAVLGVDVILLGYYYQKRRKAFAALATETVMSR